MPLRKCFAIEDKIYGMKHKTIIQRIKIEQSRQIFYFIFISSKIKASTQFSTLFTFGVILGGERNTREFLFCLLLCIDKSCLLRFFLGRAYMLYVSFILIFSCMASIFKNEQLNSAHGFVEFFAYSILKHSRKY